MELNQLRYFQAVARTGNITRAAQQLYITQPNLSKSIARLEAELGVPLFDHRKGQVRLNDYGRIFLSSVDMILSELELGTRAVQRSYEQNQHILSLASNVPGYLPDILPAFSAQNPDLGIRQREAEAQQLTELLLEGSISLAICNQELKDPALVFTTLSHTVYVVALSRRNPLARQGCISLSELSQQSLICDGGRLGRQTLTQLCLQRGFSPQISYEVESTAILLRLLQGNHGPAIIPMSLGCQLLHDHPESELALLQLSDPMPKVIIGVAMRRDQTPNRAMERFLSYLMDCLHNEEQLIQEHFKEESYVSGISE